MLSDAMGAGLVKIYEKNSDFARIFDYLAARKRNWSELVVDRLEANLKDVGAETTRRRVIVEFFRELEHLDAGKLVLGRGGRKKTRFRWNSPQIEMLEAAKAACSGGRDDSNGEILAHPNVQAPEGSRRITHQFALRTDFVVRFELPTDFTRSEAGRLSAFVKALPFDAEETGEQA